MNLHRATEHEWLGIPPAERTGWQRLAHTTNGVVTPANLVSVGGLALVVIGLYLLVADYVATGAICILVGRLADIADGLIAEATRTKSPVGEAMDASIDKIAGILAIIVLLAASILPWYAFAALGAQALFGVGIFMLARRKNGRVHPSRAGKFATALSWLVIGAYIVVTSSSGTLHTIANITAVGSLLIFGALAAVSMYDYIREYRELLVKDAK